MLNNIGNSGGHFDDIWDWEMFQEFFAIFDLVKLYFIEKLWWVIQLFSSFFFSFYF